MLSVLAAALLLNAQTDETPDSLTCHSMAAGILVAMELGADGLAGSEYRFSGLSLSEAVRVFGWNTNDIEYEVQVRQSGYALIVQFADGWANDALAAEASDYSQRMGELLDNNPGQENLFRLMLRDGWQVCADQEESDSGWQNLLNLARESIE